MSEDDGEIEYLDEDEDIVQQYVQTVALPLSLPTPTQDLERVPTSAEEPVHNKKNPLLVERKRLRKPKSEDDSDYDPNEDLELLEELRSKRRRIQRRAPIRSEFTITRAKTLKHAVNQQNIQSLNKNYEMKLNSLPNLTVQKKPVAKKFEVVKKVVKKVDNIVERKKMDIRIPDYDDPICLPVRAIKRDIYDLQKLKQWNNLCLDHYQKSDTTFKPNRGDGVSSTRTVILRNMRNKYTGKIDTTVSGRVTVGNSFGERKTVTYQGTLPKYREKNVLNSYPLQLGKHKNVKHTFEAILTKEDEKDEDMLVVYKPKEAVAAVYKSVDDKLEDETQESHPVKRAIKEVACCKSCAPCYQASWRGLRKQDKPDNLKCAVCSRTFVSVYNLLTHLNTNHAAKDVARHKAALSKTLATVVGYHYTCRVCQLQLPTITRLREHLQQHQGVELFKCEIGNHMAS